MNCPICKDAKIAAIDLEFSMAAKQYFKADKVTYICSNRHRFEDGIVVKVPKRVRITK